MNGSGGGEQQSPVFEVADRIEKELAAIQEISVRLERTLTPVLREQREPPPAAAELVATERPPTSPLLKRLESIYQQTENHRATLLALLEKVTL